MNLQLLPPMQVVEVRIVLYNDNLKPPHADRVACAVHVMADLVCIAVTALFAILPEIFQHAVVVAKVPAITHRARTATVDLVTRSSHVSRARRTRVLAVMAVRPILAELMKRNDSFRYKAFRIQDSRVSVRAYVIIECGESTKWES